MRANHEAHGRRFSRSRNASQRASEGSGRVWQAGNRGRKRFACQSVVRHGANRARRRGKGKGKGKAPRFRKCFGVFPGQESHPSRFDPKVKLPCREGGAPETPPRGRNRVFCSRVSFPERTTGERICGLRSSSGCVAAQLWHIDAVRFWRPSLLPPPRREGGVHSISAIFRHSHRLTTERSSIGSTRTTDLCHQDLTVVAPAILGLPGTARDENSKAASDHTRTY
jgi:hypothetical protein